MNKLETFLHKQIQGCPGRISVYIEMEDWSFRHHEMRPFSAASLIKIPILIEAFHQHDRRILALEESVQLKKESLVGGSGVLQALSSNSSWTIKDLIALMIIVSDNTATNMLIDLLGMDSINQSIAKLQLKKTKLQRKMMDFQAVQQGRDNITCASDIVQCLKVINKGDFLSPKSQDMAKSILQFQQFKQIAKFMESEALYVGGKTGGLPGIEHDCVVINNLGQSAYIAILVDSLTEGKSAEHVMQQIGKVIYDVMKK